MDILDRLSNPAKQRTSNLDAISVVSFPKAFSTIRKTNSHTLSDAFDCTCKILVFLYRDEKLNGVYVEVN